MKLLVCVLVALAALTAAPAANAKKHKKPAPPKLHVVYTESEPVTLCAFPSTPSCGVGSAVAYCPRGYTAIGGGWASGSLIDSTVTYNGPATEGEGWLIIMANLGAEGTFHALGVCAGTS